MKAPERSLLEPLVREVLETAHRGRGQQPHYLTAYQIVERLREPARSELITKYGRGGKRAGSADTASSIISQVLANELSAEVDVAYLDTRDVWFSIADELVEAGYPVVALYRLRVRRSDTMG
ncbi:hypothetical protein BE20_08190 [Sorangium cellulosum]|uniref:Uncharacterized protein n=1 Tax=Sorangium cellulosum TaxID=56 RepID=A0A150SDN4_SORCE|nr:hypothetical protein BE18_44640 [Sorangium cellulosum]KYF93870.1 hypothetical protein BE20_08190 [Sorangium cellulosum]